ncbi:protein DOUBLE-STRAND BREAK FORMATION [Argentina anserina]|uniref:protein DOUBLE-STRAND BREAK FORMATION n=1 Tax=Argentina anserina TaxID=57926 RepID=UPI00217676D2|nr:protein DOUBLE-STRAND BREAK FORMATION [Potentilla anserina]
MFEPFRSLVLNRRFGDETLRVLESILVSKDVKSSIEVRSALRQFMRSESFSILQEISQKTVAEKLLVLEFLVRTFALVGDVENCLALRYEALLLRDLKSATQQWLKVPHLEWFNFAQQLLDNGFYSIAAKVCENALSSLKWKSAEQPTADGVFSERISSEDPKTDKVTENEQVIEKIKRLKECAMASASSHSVQTQTADYMNKRLKQKSMVCSPVLKKTTCVASTLFRNGIKKRNERKLNESRSLLGLS